MTAEEVTAAARRFVGVRWRHQGRSRDGIDCLGLIILVAHELKQSEFDTRDYARQAKDESMLEQCREHLIEIPRADASPGDVAVMRFANQRHIGFLGDYAHGGLTLIHAYSHHPRRVVEHRFTDDWLRVVEASLIGTFRFPGLVSTYGAGTPLRYGDIPKIGGKIAWSIGLPRGRDGIFKGIAP